MKLYEVSEAITQIMLDLESCIDENTGVIDEVRETELRTQLDTLQGQRDQTLLDLAAYYKGLDAEAEALALEQKKLGERRKRLDRRTNWIKYYIRDNLEVGSKLSDSRSKLGWRKSSAVEIENDDLIPDQFCRIERRPILTTIKEAIGAGQQVPGATIVERQNLQIS